MSDLIVREFPFVVRADADLVWDALTTDEGLSTWYVTRASVDPRVGGNLEVDWGTGSYAMGSFDVVEPLKRIRLTYGGSDVGMEDWVLTHQDGETHVVLNHSLPVEEGTTWDDQYRDIVRGWLLFHSTLVWAASTRGELGRQSEVRVGPIEDGAWGRVLAALGLSTTPSPGSTIEFDGLPHGEVLVGVDGYSLLIAFGDCATLLVDVEGSDLYTLAATYGEETEKSHRMRSRLSVVAEQLCTAAGADL